MHEHHTRTEPQHVGPNRRMLLAWISAATAIAALGSALLAHASVPSRAATAQRALSCTPATGNPPAPKPTTLATVQQAYNCILEHWYGGSRLDDRVLLVAGFASLTDELQRRNLDLGAATLPALVDSRERDWAAFARTYRRILASLPNTPELRQPLAVATVGGMLEALHDDHNEWTRIPGTAPPQSSLGFQFDFEGRPTEDVPPKDIRDSTGPMYITAVAPQSAAANAGLKPGDIIEAVNDVPVFVASKFTPGIIDLLNPRSRQGAVRLTVDRPATNQTWTIALQIAAQDSTRSRPARAEGFRPNGSGPTGSGPAGPAPGGFQPPDVSAKLIDGIIAYVMMPSFSSGDADQVLNKISQLRRGAHLRGVILDLRGNGGGRGEEVAKLLGAFAHHKIWAWDCDIDNHCTPHSTNDTVPLMHLPLVELTDGRCASACDAFSAAVKDLRLGKLVGARTAGVVSGPPTGFRLTDGSLLGLTVTHELAPNRERIDGIGVAVDYQAPLTARDLSIARDPGLEKALSLLRA